MRSCIKGLDIFYGLPDPTTWNRALSSIWDTKTSLILEKLAYALMIKAAEITGKNISLNNTVYSLILSGEVDFAECCDASKNPALLCEEGFALSRNVPAYFEDSGIFPLFCNSFFDWEIRLLFPCTDCISYEYDKGYMDYTKKLKQMDNKSLAELFNVPPNLAEMPPFMDTLRDSINIDSACVMPLLIIYNKDFSAYTAWRKCTTIADPSIEEVIQVLDEMEDLFLVAFPTCDSFKFETTENTYFVYMFDSMEFASYNYNAINTYATLNPRMLLAPYIIEQCISLVNSHYHFLDEIGKETE